MGSRLASVVVGAAMVAVACADDTAAIDEPPYASTPGVIVSTGAEGIVLSTADGAIIASPGTDAPVTQPTWSRDGRRIVASSRGSEGFPSVVVRDGATGDVVSTQQAVRPYFFFSWSDDGKRIAALGPGLGGTTLDILDGGGRLVTETLIEGGSVYVAWEPGGSDLLVHQDQLLLLLPEADEPVVLGVVGRDFLAPSWVPGTREAVIVVTDEAGPRVRRASIDEPLGGEDLGEADGATGVVVDPSGTRVAVIHLEPAATDDGGTIITAAFSEGSARPVQFRTATTEIIELATGERTPVIDTPTFWTEWSPEGDALLVGTVGADRVGATWWVWEDDEISELVDFIPSAVFLERYIAFADQYVEQPRLWAPDGTAFAFAGLIDGEEFGVVVVGLSEGDEAIRIGDGVVAFWSPVDPAS